MSSVRIDIVSIGTLSRNRLWGESVPVRPPHATTTLVRSGKRHILVNPALPAQMLAARLSERTGLDPAAIDTVFLTSLRADHRAGLSAFPKAKLFTHELEIQHARMQLEEFLERTPEEEIDKNVLQSERDLLQRIQVADDKLADHVDLFPLFGHTPGACGLLVLTPTVTTLLAGDAVASQDHFLAGQVLPDAMNVEAAQESLREAYEIADLIVPGRDNLFLNPRTQGM
jgi:glyoxylase-like metal-dependent hydrolase (beta-lactamase superfamily II)